MSGESDFAIDEWRALVDTAADWLWETDRNHCFTWMSENYIDAVGVHPDVVLGRSRLDFLKQVAKTSKTAAAHLDDLKSHRAFREFVYEATHTPPECRWISVAGFPRFDAKGEFLGYRGVGRNVTAAFAAYGELDEARRRLREHEARERQMEEVVLAEESHAERMMAALNVLDDAFCYYDNEDRLVLYNDATLRIYSGVADIVRPGVSFPDLLDTGMSRGIFITDPYDPVVWRKNALELRRSATRTHSTLHFSDGRWIMRRDMRTKDGGIIAICTDITRFKSAEGKIEQARAEAEAAQARLQSAIDALDDGFVLWDAEDRLVACNDAFRRQFDFLPQLGPGRGFADLAGDVAASGKIAEAIGREAAWVAEQVAQRDLELDQEIVYQTPEGRWIRRRDQLTASGDRVGVQTDVTELMNREQALAEASAKSGELAYNLQRTIDQMPMGIVVLDANLEAEIVNKAFYEIWKVTPEQVGIGSPFRALMDVNRHNGVYDVPDSEWEDYVEGRLAELRAGEVESREFRRADGFTVIYTVIELSGGKRLVSYYDITEMKEREAQLAIVLERTRLADAVINGVGGPIFVKDSDLKFVLVNEAFSSLFGLSPQAMIGKTGGHFVSLAEADRFEESERHVLRTGETYEVEEDFEFQGIGKSRIVRKNRVRMGSGKDYVAGFLVDISDLKRREIEIEEARQRLESVIESLPAGVVIYDRHNRFVLGNKLVKDALPALGDSMKPGKPLRDAIEAAHGAGYFRNSGDTALDSLYDHDPQAWVELYMRRYDERQGVYERLNPDGNWHKVFDTRTPDGTFVGVRVDITELKNREAALRNSMAQIDLFRNVLDDLPVAAFVKNDDLSLRFVNKAWCTITGIDKDQAIGSSDRELFGAAGEGFASRDIEVLATGRVNQTEETLIRRDGSELQLIARKSRLVLRDGTVHLIGSSSDVTQLKARELELEEAKRKAVLADRAKSEFLANMSHEIRTPMNGVLGMAELLSKSDLDPKQKTFTDIIVKSGNALLTIINDILDFSKIDAGQLVLDPAPFSLSEAIEDVATLVSTRAKEKDLELIVRVQPDLPETFVGDVGRIRQIITNLLGNAVKFTDSGHVLVDVTGENQGDRTALSIAVTDTGIGIPPEKLSQVFEKFSQVDASSTRRHEGTGLGLAITSRLVELMQGKVEVTSIAGHGSTFTVRITMEHGSQMEGRKHAPVDVTGARVLIVDDNPVNRAILMEQMTAWSFDACAAESGPEGLRVLEVAAEYGLKVDCVVLDYQMPGMTGAEMARLVRTRDGISETPIVMLTSVDQSLTNKSYRDIAINAHLIKPARSSALLDAIVTTIQRARARLGHMDELPPAACEPAPVEKTVAASAAPVAASATSPAAHGGVDILVAEDNEVNQLVFTQILSETPYRFEIVGNGRQAVAAYGEMAPRMILMDVSMPEMNGLEATAAIRELETATGRHVPIVGVTAHALKGDRERCLEAGMDDYLSKPISPNALLAKLERWMAESSAAIQATG